MSWWPWRRHRARHVETEIRPARTGPDPEPTPDPPVMPPEELDRATRAAEHAQARLRESRGRQVRVESRISLVQAANRENHFAELMREAFGGRA